jgi:hypothetical protein
VSHYSFPCCGGAVAILWLCRRKSVRFDEGPQVEDCSHVQVYKKEKMDLQGYPWLQLLELCEGTPHRKMTDKTMICVRQLENLLSLEELVPKCKPLPYAETSAIRRNNYKFNLLTNLDLTLRVLLTVPAAHGRSLIYFCSTVISRSVWPLSFCINDNIYRNTLHYSQPP